MQDSHSNTAVQDQLVVYKASAGSGKTFTLAVEYIKLLIDNPKGYENILAVTFTNKATEEMKMRILSQLYGLWKQLPNSNSYMEVIKKETNYDEKFISQRAGIALHLMLHNYHSFKVQTIDTFFQAVLRNLARELQLNTNLRVGLNKEQVISESVDNIIDSLSENKGLMRIIMNYIDDNLQDDKKWNVIQDIKTFGQNIFSEVYKQNRKSINATLEQKDFFTDYKKELRTIRNAYEVKYKRLGTEVIAECDRRGFCAQDFSFGASGPFGYFVRLTIGKFTSTNELVGKRVIAGREDAKKWSSAKSPRKAEITDLATTYLIPKIEEIEKMRLADIVAYRSAVFTLQHLNDIQLLHTIEDTAHRLNDAEQRFMLNDTQSLLHEMIGDSDAPFIFEKIGSRLDHIMIDEFQDTSTIQWANFKTLLKECMSKGMRNLIVGDVKQSIYRFREGDWRLLNGIENEFKNTAHKPDIQTRKTNYRSYRNIITFNNAFFEALAAEEVENVRALKPERAKQLKHAYEDVKQDIPANKEKVGYVQIEMLPHQSEDDTPQRTMGIIQDLLAQEIAQKDIAILVRETKNIYSLANYIETESQGTIKIVSAEAFRLDASSAVSIIINAMKMVANNNDKLAEALLCKYHGGKLPEEFIENLYSIATMSLHDMAEEILRIFAINDRYDEGAYLTVFFDKLHEFCTDNIALLEDFLSEWEEEIYKTAIDSGEINGIRILTIHKSKGLEFSHVILPYCDWKFNNKSKLIWVTPQEAPFSRLPMVPIKYTSPQSLEESIYEDDGYEEHIQDIVDNLNLLYVAFTRAKKSLFVLGDRSKSTDKAQTRNKSICTIIQHNLPDSLDGIPLIIEGRDGDEKTTPLIVRFGEIPVQEKQEEDKDTNDDDSEKNVFTDQVNKSVKVDIVSCPSKTIFMQSNQSREFAEDSEDERDHLRLIRRGTVLHQLFERIHTLDDIDTVLQQMEFDGTLYDEDITKEGLAQTIKEKFENEQVRNWFSDEWEVLNERSIISIPEEMANGKKDSRPDRVITNGKETIVIDYKFGTPFAEYEKQVLYYMSLLTMMGMPNVKGYLWYVVPNKVKEVKKLRS